MDKIVHIERTRAEAYEAMDNGTSWDSLLAKSIVVVDAPALESLLQRTTHDILELSFEYNEQKDYWEYWDEFYEIYDHFIDLHLMGATITADYAECIIDLADEYLDLLDEYFVLTH